MTKTFEELLKIDNFVGTLYKNDPKLRNTKFGYAYKRFVEKNLNKTLDDYRGAITILRIEAAMEDPKTKELLLDSNQEYKYTKEAKIQLLKDEKKTTEEWYAKEIVIEPFITSHIPEGMLEEEIEELKGLIFE